MWWRWWSMALIFLATHFPQKQLLPSEVSFRPHIYFILAYFGNRLCRHFEFQLNSAAAHAQFMTHPKISILTVFKHFYFNVYISDTHFNKWNAFLPLQLPPIKFNNKLQSLTLSKNYWEIMQFKRNKKFSLHMHIFMSLRVFHSSALLLTVAAAALLVV